MNKKFNAAHSVTGEVTGWSAWWSGLSAIRKFGPICAVLVYFTGLSAIEGLRRDHLTVAAIYLLLSYGGRAAQSLLSFLMPLILTAAIYDSMRFYSHFIRSSYIRVQEPYFFDKMFFGIQTANGILTPNEWWQLHTHPILDFFAGLSYLVFIAIFVLTSAYFYFWLSRQGTRKHSAEWIRLRAPGAMWSFFWLNVLGYSTYHVYPAAPPWYVSLYGLGPANLEAKPNPAGCVRFDALFGTQIFQEFYGRSADVFGAIPSLHVAYPFLAILFAFQFGAVRGFSVFFYLLISFAAVYLNHHYILDVMWGTAYAVFIYVVINRYYERKIQSLRRRQDLPVSL